MRVVIIGGGVFGLIVVYYFLCMSGVEVILYEVNDYIGGYIDIYEVLINGENVSVDIGFIVFNEYNYLQFICFLWFFGVVWQDMDMSFSVVNECFGMEYGVEGFKWFFVQKWNLINLFFYCMLWDLMCFYCQILLVLFD